MQSAMMDMGSAWQAAQLETLAPLPAPLCCSSRTTSQTRKRE